MFSLFAQWAANAQTALDRHRAVETLSRLSDLQLRDIGLERHDIENHVRQGLPWQDRARSPLHRARPAIQGCG